MNLRRVWRCGALLTILLWASACEAVPISPTRTPSALNPQGPAAAHLADLWWVMFTLGTVIFLLVILLMLAALWRRRRATSATEPESRGGDTGRRWLLLGGIALPLVVLAVTFGYSTYTLAAVEIPHAQATINIQLVGRRWWWQVSYPDKSVETANEIHMPVGVPVQIQLESADVIHSLWIPELHGKMDLIPSRINSITLQADHAGVFRGECAEFCGLQHAHMDLMVVAQSQDEYNAWLDAQQKPAGTPPSPEAAEGQQLFLLAGCSFCHTVRGLEDRPIDRSGVDLGPDLTHLASRLTIAGASLTLNKGNLAGWVVDPQHVKPGSLMPPNYIGSKELQSLLAYLTSLQ